MITPAFQLPSSFVMGRTIKAAAHHNDQWVGDEMRWTSPLAKCKNRPTYQRSSLVHRVLPYLLTYRLLVVLLLPLLSLFLSDDLFLRFVFVAVGVG